MGWVIATALLAAVAGGLARLWWQQAAELARLRERYANERSSHYRTWSLLTARERQIGRLGERLRGLEEIAAASAIGAQLYQAMVAELRETDATEIRQTTQN